MQESLWVGARRAVPLCTAIEAWLVFVGFPVRWLSWLFGAGTGLIALLLLMLRPRT